MDSNPYTILVIGLERVICTCYGLNLFKPWCITMIACVNCDIRGFGYLHHKALSIVREIVTGLPNFSIEHHGV